MHSHISFEFITISIITIEFEQRNQIIVCICIYDL